MIKRREILAGGILAGAAGWLASPEAALAQRRSGVVDLTAPFWPAYKATRKLGPASRAPALLKQGFPVDETMPVLAPTSVDILNGWLPGFDPLADKAMALRERFPALWQTNITRMGENFVDYRANARADLTMSMFKFAAETMMVLDDYDVVVGLDEVVRRGMSDQELAIHLTQQSVHCLHYRVNWRLLPVAIPLWLSLWTEGVARYASLRLHDASHADALFDPALAARPAGDLKAAATQMVPLIDVASDTLNQRYIKAQGDRMGLLIGLRIVERQARIRSLTDFIRMPGMAARDIVRSELMTLSV